jgi:hypothetical protein
MQDFAQPSPPARPAPANTTLEPEELQV